MLGNARGAASTRVRRPFKCRLQKKTPRLEGGRAGLSPQGWACGLVEGRGRGQRDAVGNLEQLETHAHKGSRKVPCSVLSKTSPRSKSSCFHSQEERNTGEANVEPTEVPGKAADLNTL